MAITEAVSQELVEEKSERVPARAKRRGHVRVFGKWCKGCGLCIAFCPKQVFEEDHDHHPVVTHPENCIGCEWCEIHCPDFAISVEPYVEGGIEGVAK